MERARLRSAGDTEWVIAFADAFAMASVQRNQAFLEETVAALAGHPVKVRFVQEVEDRWEAEEATVAVPAAVENRAARWRKMRVSRRCWTSLKARFGVTRDP